MQSDPFQRAAAPQHTAAAWQDTAAAWQDAAAAHQHTAVAWLRKAVQLGFRQSCCASRFDFPCEAIVALRHFRVPRWRLRLPRRRSGRALTSCWWTPRAACRWAAQAGILAIHAELVPAGSTEALPLGTAQRGQSTAQHVLAVHVWVLRPLPLASPPARRTTSR